MMTDLDLLRVAITAYVLATGAAALDLITPRGMIKSLEIRALWLGFAAHLGAIVWRSVTAGYPPLTNTSESLSVLGFLIVAGFLLLQIRRPMASLAMVIAPLAFALTLGADALYADVAALPPNLRSALLPIHVSLAVLGNALFGLSFAVSLAYLIKERSLKARRIGGRLRLPSLETLDRLNFRFLTWGLSSFTLAIVSGIVWAHLVWGRFWSGEPRLVWAGCTWIVYALVFQGRVIGGMRGRRAAALTILGFATLVLSLIGGNTLMPGRHGGTFG